MEYGIIIYCESDELKRQIGEKIHNKLKGNPDYIENRIILNIDNLKTIHIWIEYGIEIPASLETSNIHKITKECKEALE